MPPIGGICFIKKLYFGYAAGIAAPPLAGESPTPRYFTPLGAGVARGAAPILKTFLLISAVIIRVLYIFL